MGKAFKGVYNLYTDTVRLPQAKAVLCLMTFRLRLLPQSPEARALRRPSG